MKTKPLIMVALVTMGALMTPESTQAQHGHLNAGALGSEQGSKLYFANGDIFTADSGYVKDLTFTNAGRYAGFFQGSITPTALPATTNNGGPVLNHAALRSFLQAEIVSVTGPQRGSFGFWENGATNPTFSISSGTFDSSFRFDLSDASLGAGQPGADPFGHLHGRRFTVSDEGIYTVGFRILDSSANGTAGSPIHIPSDTLFISFSTFAIPEPTIMAMLGLRLVFGGLRTYREKSKKKS